jgi:PAS domain S-box-containing protein
MLTFMSETEMYILKDKAIENRSITRQLIASITITIIFVSLIAITAMYHVVSRAATRSLENKADETLSYLVGSLEEPLWVVDIDGIRKIGKAISQEKSVAGLVIRNESGEIIYSMENKKSGDLIIRTSKIFYKVDNMQYFEGDVSISITKSINNTSNNQLLFSSIFIIFLILASVVLVTVIIVRSLLNRPLQHLNEIANRFASGIYNTSGLAVPYLEFQPFGKVLSQMAGEIHQQIRMIKDAESKYRYIFENALEGIFQSTVEGQLLNTNLALAQILGYTSRNEFLAGVSNFPNDLYNDSEERGKLLSLILERGIVTGYEARFRRRDDQVIWVSMSARMVRDDGGVPLLFEGFLTDISEQKWAEEERLNHLQFLESMDRINRALHGTNDYEQMLGEALEVVLSIFDCDRAFLLYPCDPDAALWRVPLERHRPGFSNDLAEGLESPMDEPVAETLRTLLAAEGPVSFGPGTSHPLPENVSQRFGFKSFMAMALHPKIGKPWQFGIHQCTLPRLWTQEEERLMQEIGRRLADALTGLMAYRDLQESEAKYRRIVNTASEGIWVFGPDDRTTFVNARMAEMLGYSCAEMEGQPFTDFLFEEDLPDHYQKMESRHQGCSANYERRFHHKDGRVVWAQLSATAVVDAERRFLGSFGMFTDITERKQAEEALRRLNRELRAISDCNQVLVRAEDEKSLLDKICRIICEEAGYRMAFVGYAENDEARTIRPVAWAGNEDGYLANAKLTWADEVERGRGPAGKAIRRGETIYVQDIATDPQMGPWREYALQHGYRSCIALPLKGERGEVYGLLAIYSAEANAFTSEENRLLEELAGDLAFGITVLRTRLEHRQAEEKISRLALIVESSDDAIVGYSLDGLITSWNYGAEKIYGYSQSEVAGKSISYLVPHGREDETREILDRIKAGEHFEHYESVRQRKDGQQFPISLTISPVFDPQGKVVAASAIGRDISEKNKLEEQLRQAQKMEAIGTLAGGVAHDFNNILTAIIGFATLAERKMIPEDPLRAFVDQILASADRAAHLTKGLLAFSRKQVLLPRAVDLNSIIKSVESLLRRLIGEDIELTIRVSDESQIMMADTGQIEQVIMNLATNARDAMPRGGRLAITTEMLFLDTDFVDAHGSSRAGRYCLVTVSDDGLGMDEATRAKIFEPFFTTKEQGKGTGLGLSIAYGIIKQHDGFINVYSEPGMGTTFRIYLPLIETAAKGECQKQSAEPLGGTETILLAEDDQDVRSLATTVLRNSGYQVVEAVDGLDALNKYLAHNQVVDLVILDVIMPRMSGREALDRIRAVNPDTKALFLSGYTADVLSSKGLFTNAIGFLPKPMSPMELLNKVREILDGDSQHSETTRKLPTRGPVESNQAKPL